MTTTRWLLAVGVITASVTTGALATPAQAHGGPTIVRPGESIQAALDAARRGDRIVVRAGTYAEQLTVSTDGIDLVGLGAVIVPPATTTANTCTDLAGAGTEAGICVTGVGVELAEFVAEHRKVLSVGEPVRNVSITGFDVRGASGPDIAIVGADRAVVSRNRLTDGAQYGVLAAGSRATRISHNVVSSTGPRAFIGICVDDVTPAHVVANDVSETDVGLCIQTSGTDVRDNTVHGTCIGIYVDPGISDARLRSNEIGPTGASCPADNAYGMYGVILAGTVRAVVRDNRISGQHGDAAAIGLAVVDAGPSGPLATANRVTHNQLTDNDLDVLVDTTSTGNRVTRNRCTTSQPSAVCG